MVKGMSDKLEIHKAKNQIHEIVHNLEWDCIYATKPLFVPVYVHYKRLSNALVIIKVLPCVPSQQSIVATINITKLERDLNNDYKIGRLL